MTEQDIQRKIIAYLDKLPNTWVVKTISVNKRGCPDLLACIDKKFFAFEVKTPKGRVSQIQSVQIERINSAGGHACVVRSVADVVAAIGENSED